MPSLTPTHRNGRRAVVALAVLAVLAASLPATAVAGHPDDGSTDASDFGIASGRATCPTTPAPTHDTASPTFSPSANSTSPRTPNESADLAVARGDVAVVPLSVPASANVTVTLGSDDGYAARLGVRDDGDGQFRLLVNTYLAGNRTTVAPSTYRAADDDAVTVLGGTPTAPLEPGTYPVTARRNGSVVAERNLTVTDPSVESVTARRAVPQLFDATNASEIRAANRSGLIRPLRPGEHGPEALEGETVVLRIDAPSLLGAIAAQSGNTTTQRFLALHPDRGPATPETFEIFGPCGGIRLPASAAQGSVRAVADYREGTVYVSLDVDAVAGIGDGRQTVYLELAADSRLNVSDTEREFTTQFRVGQQSTTLRRDDADAVRLTADASARIVGETNLLPGSSVRVRVESRVAPTFVRQTTATVAANGTFAATVNLSNASTPGVFAVTAGGEQFPATAGDAPPVHWKLTHYGGSDRVDELRLDRPALPDGGFLVAYQYDPGMGEFRQIGSATANADELAVEPLTDPQYVLVVAHRDANGNRAFDGPAADPTYRVGGSAVRDWVGITVSGVEPSGGPPSATFDPDRVTVTGTEITTTSGPTTATASESTSSTTSNPTTATPGRDDPQTTTVPQNSTRDGPDASGAEVPGFGAVTALFALLVLLGTTALLRTRRR